jgi:Flp pilus assembly protein TadD
MYQSVGFNMCFTSRISKATALACKRRCRTFLTWFALALAGLMVVPSVSAQPNAPLARLTSKKGIIHGTFANGTEVDTDVNAPRNLYSYDTIRTMENGSAVVRLKKQNCSIKLRELSTLEILPSQNHSSPLLNLLRGALYYCGWQKFHDVQIRTPHATGAPRGTEFVMIVEPDRTLIAMFDGVASLTNQFGCTTVQSGEIGIARNGQAPVKMRLEAQNIVQWWLYYPGVLDVDELNLNSSERTNLAASLAAYRSGDLPAALSEYPGYPTPSKPVGDSGKIYLAALLLGAGEVGKTENLLNDIQTNSSVAESLRWVIAAVQHQTDRIPQIHTSASEWLGLSYYFQARHELNHALAAAEQSVAFSTNFAFGWERVAELEFSFGRVKEAKRFLRKSLLSAPKNAEAHALNGFLFSAENNLTAATREFDEAIRLNPSLGNGWLGRGLVRIRRGDRADGLADLQMAAILEPNRSLFRSYLGKAFADAGEVQEATRQLTRATELDANDPTPWLYSALLKQQGNQINGAITNMEMSQSLNDNRQLFRSRMLLDQDNAVRSANLATMYRDAGMDDVSVREAAKAVAYDYDNASAHLFLSDSYDALRDPTRFNLRYETAWFNELLLANLLAPVGAGRLSQTVSAQEYSKLFESDGLGFASQSSWRSDGQYHQLASQSGTYGNTSWALDLDYQHNSGVRPNNELNSIEWYSTIKQQLTPSDSVLLLAKYEDYTSGDNFQYYDPNVSYRPNYQYDEQQQPILIGGLQHEWSPGIHTLLLGGRLVTKQEFSDRQDTNASPLLLENSSGAIDTAITTPFDVSLQDQLEIYTAEFSQIVQRDKFTLVAGARWQGGQIDFSDSLTNSPYPPAFLPPVAASFSEPFQRLGGYGYLTIEPVTNLWLTGGAAYDTLKFPANFRSLPETAGTDERSLFEPKAAVVWNPFKQVTLRGIYSRSLGGVSLDESYRLEPTQLAGFVQTFRSVIPESIVGSVPAEDVELEGLALDFKFGHGTFAGLQVQHLDCNVRQTVGDFLLVNGNSPFVPSSTSEHLDYSEQTFSASINQLLPDGFVAGASYQLTHSELKTTFPQIPISVSAPQDQSATLHQIGAYLLYNHPSGLFARFDAHAYLQANHGYTPAEPGDDFVQLDLQGGWRFFQRRAELRVGILNLTGQDYRLNPLNAYSELPRSRVFMAQFSFEF